MAAAKASTRKPKVAISVELSEKARASSDEAKRLLVAAVSSLPASRLKNLKSGVITVIA